MQASAMGREASLEAFRTPASVHPLAPAPGRHPKTLNVSGRLWDRDRTARFDPNRKFELPSFGARSGRLPVVQPTDAPRLFYGQKVIHNRHPGCYITAVSGMSKNGGFPSVFAAEGVGFEPSVPHQIRSPFRDRRPVSHAGENGFGLPVPNASHETVKPSDSVLVRRFFRLAYPLKRAPASDAWGASALAEV